MVNCSSMSAISSVGNASAFVTRSSNAKAFPPATKTDVASSKSEKQKTSAVEKSKKAKTPEKPKKQTKAPSDDEDEDKESPRKTRAKGKRTNPSRSSRFYFLTKELQLFDCLV